MILLVIMLIIFNTEKEKEIMGALRLKIKIDEKNKEILELSKPSCHLNLLETPNFAWL